MTNRNEQRWCIEFCQKVADTQSDTIKKVQEAFGDEAMGVAVIKFRFNCLKNGRESIESNTLPGRPSTNRNQKSGVDVRVFVVANLHIAVREKMDFLRIHTSHFY